MDELKCPNCGNIATTDPEAGCAITYIDTVDLIRDFEGIKDGKVYFNSLSRTDYDSSREDRLFCESCLHEWPVKFEDFEFDKEEG